MYPEVGDRHFPRGDEGSGAGEQSGGDQEPRDQLDQPGVPPGPGPDHDGMRRADGPTEEIRRAVRGEEETIDQPKQAQHSRRIRGETVVEILRHEVDVTGASSATHRATVAAQPSSRRHSRRRLDAMLWLSTVVRPAVLPRTESSKNS